MLSLLICVYTCMLIMCLCCCCLQSSLQSNTSNSTDVVLDTETCSSPVSYTGTICRDELRSITQCLPNDSRTVDLLVGSDSSLQQAQAVVGSLELFASPECVAAATPLLCVYLFEGVCDDRGVRYLPSREECTEISATVCKTDPARSVGMVPVDCAALPINPPSSCYNYLSQGNDTNGNLGGCLHSLDWTTELDYWTGGLISIAIARLSIPNRDIHPIIDLVLAGCCAVALHFLHTILLLGKLSIT